jgi:hypothetical protein
MITFYDQSGEAVAYLDEDGESIYLYGGEPIAFLSGEGIYSYAGRYLGWFEDGWVLDRSGNRVFFTENATGGPVRPVRAVRPARGARSARPARGAREARPARPVRSSSWSRLTGENFFS